jgi:predicted amidohydrolase YtcJ|tara:strand:+ start:370 stop:2085 length:1716 start_codon:yes stop_codon:yes gene_type:complete
MKNSVRGVFVTGLIAVLMSTGCAEKTVPVTVDTIYFNGNVITLDSDELVAEAIAIKNGKITAVGDSKAIMSMSGENTRKINLNGKTLVPGFIDAHSHLSGVAVQVGTANLLPPPDGPVQNIAALQQTLREFMATSDMVKQHSVVIGFNYDDSQLEEARHPNRQELDAVSTEMPIMITHQSGHIGVYNTKALEMFGITAESVDPAGGVIRREEGTKEPNGVLEENAHFALVYKMIPSSALADYLSEGEKQYLSNGFTTIQDGKTDPATLAFMVQFAVDGRFLADVVSYADVATMTDYTILNGPLHSDTYVNNFRIGGVKLTFDGSPQGKTAWFTKPYLVAPLGQDDSYLGYPAFTNEDALKWFSMAYENDWQMLTHTNGDAAIDQLIDIAGQAAEAFPGEDRRTVMIHGQFLREDQIDDIKRLGIFPALYPMHTFYWGDWHRDSVAGKARAENISPTGWMIDRDIKFSVHSDAPVTFPNSMRILDSAVNRTTRSGAILGESQRLRPMDALKAMTIWPAYQHFEEASKGSLEVGKLADMVILDQNPLSVDPANIKGIKVLETIKEDVSVYIAQ